MARSLHQLSLRIYRLLPDLLRRWIVRVIAPTNTVGEICFIERSIGDLLLVRHAYRSRWGAPGGLLQRGEEPTDAARREVMEEVGLAIELLGEPAVVVDAEPQRIDLVFRARPAAGSDPDAVASGSPEITDVRWFPRDHLPELQFEAADALVALARASTAGGRVPLLPVLGSGAEPRDRSA
jgi:8-oxo-dGTP pyrophosphatase MutT (NUDIX family)